MQSLYEQSLAIAERLLAKLLDSQIPLEDALIASVSNESSIAVDYIGKDLSFRLRGNYKGKGHGEALSATEAVINHLRQLTGRDK